MTLNLFLILIGWTGLSYLIYRYARYSPWRSTVMGKAFMMMKAALWALFTFVLVARFLPNEPWRELIMTSLLLFTAVAISWQASTIVKLQGGIRRREARTPAGVSERRRATDIL